MKRFAIQVITAFFAVTMFGSIQAKEKIEASATQNPAPTEAFSAFDRFEISPVTMGKPYAGQEANERAKLNLQLNLDERVNPWIKEKNAQASKNSAPRALLIEPRIEKVRFIGTGARVWAGAFAGKSALLIKVRFTDKESGKVIAEPEFYQHAAGMAGAYSFGAADKAMIERISSLVAQYMQDNYAQAVGGKTGKE